MSHTGKLLSVQFHLDSRTLLLLLNRKSTTARATLFCDIYSVPSKSDITLRSGLNVDRDASLLARFPNLQ